MGIKTILYILCMPMVIWTMDAININAIFKKNRPFQSTMFYIILAICITYLVVNFFFDFFTYSRFI